MSYTMTLDVPQEAAWFACEWDRMSPKEMGELFVAFLMERRARMCRRNDDLAALAGSWVDDPAMEKAFADMDKVDDDLSYEGLLTGDYGQFVRRPTARVSQSA